MAVTGGRALATEQRTIIREDQQTGFASRKALAGATAGREVKPWELLREMTWDGTKPRGFGRDVRTIEAIKVIRDLDPQVAQGIWNFVRLCNPGNKLLAMTGTGQAEVPDDGAQAYFDELVDRVGSETGAGVDGLVNQLILSTISIGALAAEVAPTGDLADVDDWYAIEPLFLAFHRDLATWKLTLGQRFRDGTFNVVNPLQVFYIPLDPDVGDPYGRPPLLPAMTTAIAKASLLNDIRAAAHAAGVPRLDVKVVTEMLRANAPLQLQSSGREADLVAWMDKQLDAIVNDYEHLQPDDTFVHQDWLEITILQGGSQGFAFDKLEEILTRQLNQAIKQLPIMAGVNDSTTESHGSVQWQIQVATIKAVQKLVKRLIEHLGNTSLALKGFQAHAKLRIDEVRTVDRLFEAQSDVLETAVLKTQVAIGWRDNDEAANIATGHDAVGEALPGTLGEVVPQAVPPGGENAGQTQPPASNEKKSIGKLKSGEDMAWELAGQMLASPARSSRRRRRSGWTADTIAPVLEEYEKRARAIYETQAAVLRELLKANGIVTEFAHRDEPRDIADDVFGLSYSRQMKGLLRDAVEEGMASTGISDPTAPELLVDKIWEPNRVYTKRIRDDLKDAIRSDEFKTLDDVSAWLDSNAYREELMGRFLAKQGLEGGYAVGVHETKPDARFTWTLGDAAHCNDCLDRDGESYTYEELVSIGFPGSDSLECAANCKCSVPEEEAA